MAGVGQFYKNRGTGGNAKQVVVPSGTSAERPDNPAVGGSRFNTTSGKLEVFNGVSYDTLSIAGLANVIVDTFTGDGSTVVFGSMTNAVDDATDILVFIGGVFQAPTTTYTVDGSYDITFTSSPPLGVEISVIHNLNSTDAA